MNARRTNTSEKAVEPDVVARVERTAPSHAPGMQALVGIGVGVRQGEPYDAMRVDFELSCGTASLLINGGEFVVSLATCHVVLALENCEIRPHSRYEHRIAAGTVEATATEIRDRSNSRELGAGVELTLDSTPTTWIGAKLRGKANRTRKAGDSTKEVVKRQSRIDLVIAAGQDRWQVGDPAFGDARRSDGRLLGTYFGEERDEGGEPRALCVVAARNLDETSTVTVSAVVRFGQLLVHLGTEPATPPQREDVDAALTKLSRHVAAAHRRRADDLRCRMAGLVLSKAMQAAQRDPGLPVIGEALVARQSITVAPRRAVRPTKGEA